MKYDIPLSKPDITDEDRDAVVATLRGTRLTMGSALLEFEAHLASVVRRPFAIGVSSAGTGLEICLRALRIGPGDEVFNFLRHSFTQGQDARHRWVLIEAFVHGLSHCMGELRVALKVRKSLA